MANANTDTQQIKQALGQEVIPAVTGKPSRVLKEKPKQRVQKVTAAGASLYEIAAAIKRDPSLTVEEAIKQGKKEKKEEERSQYGIGGKGKEDFLTGALGHGIGGFLSKLIDTRANRARKKEEATLNDLPRQFEEGSSIKANFLKGLLGEKVGGLVSRTLTPMSTKMAALEKYQELTRSREVEEFPRPKGIPYATANVKKVAEAKAKVVANKPKPNPQREEAQKALSGLGYNKEEIAERLQHAPENASTEEYIRHGLNPTTTPLSKPEAVATASQLKVTDVAKPSAQEQSTQLGKEEDTQLAVKKQELHNKKVEEDLEEIKKKLGKQHGGFLDDILGKMKSFLGGMFGGLLKLVPKLASLLPSLLRFLGPAAAVAGAGFAGYELGKYLDKKFGLHERVVKNVENIQTVAHRAMAKITGEPLTKEDAIKKGVYSFYEDGNKAKGTILTRQEIQKSVSMGHPVPLQQGQFFADHHDVEQMWARQHPDLTAKPKDTVGVIVRPKAPQLTAPQVGAVSAEQKDLAQDKSNDTSAIVGAVTSAAEANMATTTAAFNNVKKILPAIANKASADPGGVLVKVRNDESSQAAYVAQIFDHPASWGGMDRM